jgi:hypothetical protein
MVRRGLGVRGLTTRNRTATASTRSRGGWTAGCCARSRGGCTLSDGRELIEAKETGRVKGKVSLGVR